MDTFKLARRAKYRRRPEDTEGRQLRTMAKFEFFFIFKLFLPIHTHTHTLILSGGLHQPTLPQCRPGLSREWPLQPSSQRQVGNLRSLRRCRSVVSCPLRQTMVSSGGPHTGGAKPAGTKRNPSHDLSGRIYHSLTNSCRENRAKKSV